jgi:hypothetical protein
MRLPDPIVVAVIAGLITLIGYFITSALERRRAVRIREMEFRLAQYKEFLSALTEQEGAYNARTHVRFVSSVNALLLIGGPRLLRAIKELVESYNSDRRAADRTWEIVDEIIYQMRRDLNAPGAKELGNFKFPIIVPDLEKLRETENGDEVSGGSE